MTHSIQSDISIINMMQNSLKIDLNRIKSMSRIYRFAYEVFRFV